jgi:hypothetical protein
MDEGILKVMSEAFNLLLQMVVARARNKANMGELANLSGFLLFGLLILL